MRAALGSPQQLDLRDPRSLAASGRHETEAVRNKYRRKAEDAKRQHAIDHPDYQYYCAMIIDPILRFKWIFHVIFKGDVQHALGIALSEVIRRGIWSLFCVEKRADR